MFFPDEDDSDGGHVKRSTPTKRLSAGSRKGDGSSPHVPTSSGSFRKPTPHDENSNSLSSPLRKQHQQQRDLSSPAAVLASKTTTTPTSSRLSSSGGGAKQPIKTATASSSNSDDSSAAEEDEDLENNSEDSDRVQEERKIKDKTKSDKNKIVWRLFKHGKGSEGGAKGKGQVVIVDHSEDSQQQQVIVICLCGFVNPLTELG